MHKKKYYTYITHTHKPRYRQVAPLNMIFSRRYSLYVQHVGELEENVRDEFFYRESN